MSDLAAALVSTFPRLSVNVIYDVVDVQLNGHRDYTTARIETFFDNDNKSFSATVRFKKIGGDGWECIDFPAISPNFDSSEQAVRSALCFLIQYHFLNHEVRAPASGNEGP